MNQWDESTSHTSEHPTAPGATQPFPGGSLPTTGPTQSAAPAADGPRTGTIVGGLVLVLLGLGVTAIGAGASLDLQAALIVLLVVAGIALLAGAALSARRRDRS